MTSNFDFIVQSYITVFVKFTLKEKNTYQIIKSPIKLVFLLKSQTKYKHAQYPVDDMLHNVRARLYLVIIVKSRVLPMFSRVNSKHLQNKLSPPPHIFIIKSCVQISDTGFFRNIAVFCSCLFYSHVPF